MGGIEGQFIRQTTLNVKGQPSGTVKSGAGGQRTYDIAHSAKTFHTDKREGLYREFNDRNIQKTTVNNNYDGTSRISSPVTGLSIFGAAVSAASVLATGIPRLTQSIKGTGAGDVAGLGGNKGSVGFDSVSKMESATDIESLRGEIRTATSHKSELSGELQTLKTEYDGAQEQKTKLESSIKENKAKLEKANEKQGKADGAVRGATSKLSQAKDNLSTITGQKDSAIQKYAEAQGQAESAQVALTSAQQAWDAVKDKPTIPDPNDPNKTIPNPEYAPAKAAFEKAQTDLKTAKEAEAQAKSARDEMMKQFENCQKTVENAEKMVKDAKKDLETAKKEQVEVKKEVETLTKEQQKLESDLKQQNGIIKNYENKKAEVDALDKAIPKQQKRLDEMVKDESKNNNKLNTRVDNRNNYIKQRNEIAGRDPKAEGFANTLEGKYQAGFNEKTEGLQKQREQSWNNLGVERLQVGETIRIRNSHGLGYTTYTKTESGQLRDANGVDHPIADIRAGYLD